MGYSIVTASAKVDGFGRQYLSKMSCLAYARYNNYIYQHTSSRGTGHVSKPYSKLLEEFIGMRSDEEDNSESSTPVIQSDYKKITFAPDIEKYFTQEVRDELRDMYFSTLKPASCEYDVAIHIRRGDVTGRQRDIPNEAYVKYISKLRKKYPHYSFCIYSQGDIKDFEVFKSDNMFFKLDEDLKKTFHDFVTAKVLVVGYSALSYSAALLSEGIIYCVCPQKKEMILSIGRKLSDWQPLE